MGKWTDELKSGQHNQTTGCLKNVYGYCCLGLREEVVDGIKFERINTDEYEDEYEGEYEDEYGNVTMPSRIILHRWGLDEIITEEERDDVLDILYDELEDESAIEFFAEDGNRADVLSILNDSTNIGFKGIAKVLEELGWDNS